MYSKDQLEQINLKRAYLYMKEWIASGKEFKEKLILEMHKIMMDGIIPEGGGRYRDVPVYITTAEHDFPLPEELPNLLKDFYNRLQEYHQICGMPETISALQLAAWSHAEFVAIHPFKDGNGRMSRLLLNYELLSNGYLPVYIPVQEKNIYYKLLDSYARERDTEPLEKYVRKLELRAIVNGDIKIKRIMGEIQKATGMEGVESYDLEP